MTNESKKYNTRIVAWSVIWAFSLVGAGAVYKGSAAKHQVLAVVTVVGTLVLLELLPRRSDCVR